MAKRKQPETSLEAFRSLDVVQLTEIHQKILWALGQLKEATFEEIALCLRVPKERIWKRMSELAKAEKIYRPGNKRSLQSGRQGFTWMLKDGETIPASLPGKSISDYSKSITQLSLL